MGTPSQGRQIELATDATSSFDTNSEPQLVISESLTMRQTHKNTGSIRNSRSMVSADTRISREEVSGQIVMPVDPVMLDTWLPRILGAAESTDTFALAETLPSFSVLVDRIADTHQYDGCFVSKAAFRGTSGDFIYVTLDIIGQTETTGNAYPSLTLPENTPYLMDEVVLTLISAARDLEDFELTIDNLLEAYYRNNLTASKISPKGRIVTCKATTPYTSDETALYDAAVAGAAGNLAITNGGQSTTFTFGNFKIPAESPPTPGEGEIRLTINGQAYKTSSTNELVVTNDSVA